MYNIIESSKKLNISRGECMIILNLKLNNIFCFNDFEINFSYPKKINNNLLGNEFHDEYNSFRFKKLNIFVGANASGKTSLIRAIWCVLYFLATSEGRTLSKIIDNNYDESLIEIDFLNELDGLSYLHRLTIKTINKENFEIKIADRKIKLSLGKSYENLISKFDSMPLEYTDYVEFLSNNKFNISFITELPSTEEPFNKIRFVDGLNDNEKDEYLTILNNVLKTLDPSIKNVNKSLDSDDAFVIEHISNKKIIIQKGMDLSSIPILSSGTKYGFNITNLLYSIKYHKFGIYLIDEQFPYVNSDVEASMLATMASLLGPNEQIFFTTHNTNILSLSFPIHSFYFLNKENNNVTVSCASKFENRNNISVKNMYDNDVFRTAPDVSKIYDIGVINE